MTDAGGFFFMSTRWRLTCKKCGKQKWFTPYKRAKHRWGNACSMVCAGEKPRRQEMRQRKHPGRGAWWDEEWRDSGKTMSERLTELLRDGQDKMHQLMTGVKPRA